MKSAIAARTFAAISLVWGLALAGDKALMRRHKEVAIEQDVAPQMSFIELEAKASTASEDPSVSAPEEVFVPFNASLFNSQEALFEAYARWHKQQLGKKDCCKNRAVVETPGSGLGDTVGALTAAFRYALVTGRLFFINWEYRYSWRLGLNDPGFDWDWVDAVKAGQMCPRSDVKDRCSDLGERPDDDIAYVNGTITSDHWLHKLSLDYPDLRIPGDWFGQKLIRPSTTVQKMMEPTLQQFKGHDVIGIAIRTGAADGEESAAAEGASFLSKGDENRFLQCFNAILSERTAEGKSVVAFATSDNEVVVDQLREAIGKERCLSIPGPVAHTAHPEGAPFSEEGLRKAFADFFILQYSQVAVLTQDSLFGASAVQLANIEYGMIQDSRCGQGTRHDCAADGFPPAICPHVGEFALDSLPPPPRATRPQEAVLFCFALFLLTGIMATLVVCGKLLPSELILAKLASRRWRQEEQDPQLFNFDRTRFAGTHH